MANDSSADVFVKFVRLTLCSAQKDIRNVCIGLHVCYVLYSRKFWQSNFLVYFADTPAFAKFVSQNLSPRHPQLHQAQI